MLTSPISIVWPVPGTFYNITYISAQIQITFPFTLVHLVRANDCKICNLIQFYLKKHLPLLLKKEQIMVLRVLFDIILGLIIAVNKF